MADPIDNIRRIGPGQTTPKVTAPSRPENRPPHDPQDDFIFEDKIDIAPADHLRNAAEQIDLSLEMVEALITGQLPPEAIEALSAFAPLGDLREAATHCQRIRQKGLDFIAWPNTRTLAEALYQAQR